MAVPLTLTKSYSLYSGAVDAMVQWWYGHNAVGFLLTAGFLGMMYYFVPKQAGRPVYSYRLIYCSLLGIDCFVYLGWSSPPTLHCTSRLDSITWYGDVADPIRSFLGWHD